MNMQIDEAVLNKRFKQGWLVEKTDNLNELVSKIKESKKQKKATSIGYLGNIVDVW